MKHFVIMILILLFNKVNIYSQNLNCLDFRSGKFELIDEVNQQKHVYERFEDYQTEQIFDLKTGKAIEEKGFYNLKWLGDCEYNLKLDTTKTKASDIALAVNARGGINSKILVIEENCAIITVTIADERIETVYAMCKID